MNYPRDPIGLVWETTIGDQIYDALRSCCTRVPAVPAIRSQADTEKRALGKVKYTKAIKGRRIG